MPKPRTVDLNNPFLDNLEGVTELLLVRHGEQQYRRGMTIADGVNPPLSELGERQAAAVGERLAATELGAIYASPLMRAHATGAAIARHHGIEPTVVDDLREVDLWGQLPQDKPLGESVSEDEMRAIFRESARQQRWDPYIYGEDFDAFRARVFEAVETIAANHVGERVAIACHGGVINAYLARLLGADQRQHLPRSSHVGVDRSGNGRPPSSHRYQRLPPRALVPNRHQRTQRQLSDATRTKRTQEPAH